MRLPAKDKVRSLQGFQILHQSVLDFRNGGTGIDHADTLRRGGGSGQIEPELGQFEGDVRADRVSVNLAQHVDVVIGGAKCSEKRASYGF